MIYRRDVERVTSRLHGVGERTALLPEHLGGLVAIRGEVNLHGIAGKPHLDRDGAEIGRIEFERHHAHRPAIRSLVRFEPRRVGRASPLR